MAGECSGYEDIDDDDDDDDVDEVEENRGDDDDDGDDVDDEDDYKDDFLSLQRMFRLPSEKRYDITHHDHEQVEYHVHQIPVSLTTHIRGSVTNPIIPL